MAKLVSDFVLDRLEAWGVQRIFGFPGDGINGLIGALHRAQNRFDFVQVRHEEMAAFMACGHAKFTGEIGVCMATSGPGAIHLLNGLYDAKMDHQPVLAIVGQQDRCAIGSEFQQEVDLQNLFKDVSVYVQTCMVPEQARHLIDRGIRMARAERGVATLIFPKDVQEIENAEPGRVHGTAHSGIGYHEPKIVPTEADLDRAAAVLNAGRKVAILAGAGARGAATELLAIADALGAGIAKALLGKDILPDDLPFVTGAIGLLGTRPSWNMMMNCDTLLMVGSGFPYSEFLPKEGQARGVQIDLEPKMLSLRYPMEVSLVGDATETLSALLPRLRRKEDRSWRQQLEKDIAEWWKVVEARSQIESNELNPQLPFWELSSRLPDGCILTTDSGSSANWFARHLKIRQGMLASLSGNLATMGNAVPYAIAAKFAHPHRPVIAMTGDGVMQMNGNSELITISKYWRRWADPRLIILVLNNRDLSLVTWEQRVMAGDPRYAASQDVPDFPYARYAEMLGLRGIKMMDPRDVAPGWDAALSADRPVVVEAYTDSEVPPLPPHITMKQARGYASSILKGDPNSAANIRLSFLEMVQAWSPAVKK